MHLVEGINVFLGQRVDVFAAASESVQDFIAETGFAVLIIDRLLVIRYRLFFDTFPNWNQRRPCNTHARDS